MKTLKVTAIFLLMIIIGVAGMFLLFSECENLLLLILSKPVGIGLLWLTYRLQNRFKRELIYKINH